MTDYHVGCSPLTNNIYAGKLTRNKTWSSKSDVTGAAVGAVCEHVVAAGGTVQVSSRGVPVYEITVREIKP